jgi:hypothetical protein
MTIEEKEKEMTRRVKQKLDEVNYRIYDINSFFLENKLMRDLTKKAVIVTSFTETTLQNTLYLISDPDTLEMLYVQTGPVNFVDIDDFFCREN